VAGSCAVARATADDEAAIWPATGSYFLDVVGGEVGGWVGGLAFPPWAPVPHDGAVVGDDKAPSLSLSGVVVEVGPAYPLALVDAGVAVPAPGLTSYWLGAVEAWAGEGAGHRRLRR
jgi:hypothetical protein